jgi:hypothetical protein
MSLLAPRDNRIQKTDTETYPNLFDDLIVGGDLTLNGIPLSSEANALYYNTSTKKVSYDLAGGGGGISLNEYVRANKTTTLSIPLSSDTLLDFNSVQTSLLWTHTTTRFTWVGGSTRIFQVSFIGYVKHNNNLSGSADTMYNVITLNGTNVNNSGGVAMVGDSNSNFINENVLVSTCVVGLNNNDYIEVRASSSGSDAPEFNTPSHTATGGRVFNAPSYTLIITEVT